MEDNQSSSRGTLLLVVAATIILHVALAEGQRTLWTVAVDGAVAAALVYLVHVLSRRRGGERALSPALSLVLLTLMVLPFLSHVVYATLSAGDALEVLIAYSLRNIALGLALVAAPPVCRNLAALASCFLVMFAFITAFTVVTSLLVAAYSVLGMWWLMGMAWQRLEARLATATRREIPRTSMMVAMVSVIAVAMWSMAAIGPNRATTALAGFMPTSGGRGDNSPYARGGVNDGDQLVGGQEDASSFGAVETELFLESEMPSLYDMYSETYQEPEKKQNRKSGRAISLSGDTKQREHRHRARHEEATREFSTVRQSPSTKPAEHKNLRSHAVAFVAGRTPLHLRLENYNQWDGQALSYVPEENERLRLLVRKEAGKPWLVWGGNHSRMIFPEVTTHELKIINFKSDRVPAPPNLESVHLYGLSDPSVFDWTADGMLRFDAPFIPQLTVLHVRSARTSQHNQLHKATFARTTVDASNATLHALAHKWVEGESQDWAQIAAVCQRLQSEYVLNPDPLATDVKRDRVEHFLLQAKQGPDYLFATSAAVLLQELGYRTRVVSGFYADPRNFDRESGCTGIYRDDVHFWAEVMLTDGTWVTVEPTPGYEVLYIQPTLSERFIATAAACWSLVVRNAWTLLIVLVISVIAVAARRRWAPHVLTLLWYAFHPWSSASSQVRWTVWLLESQSWLRGAARPRGTSLERWLTRRLAMAETSDRQRFQSLCQWVLYAPHQPCLLPAPEVARICRAVIRTPSVCASMTAIPQAGIAFGK